MAAMTPPSRNGQESVRSNTASSDKTPANSKAHNSPTGIAIDPAPRIKRSRNDLRSDRLYPCSSDSLRLSPNCGIVHNIESAPRRAHRLQCSWEQPKDLDQSDHAADEQNRSNERGHAPSSTDSA